MVVTSLQKGPSFRGSKQIGQIRGKYMVTYVCYLAGCLDSVFSIMRGSRVNWGSIHHLLLTLAPADSPHHGHATNE